MKLIAGIFAFVTIILLIIAFFPLLGWMNWAVIPFALISLVISVLAKAKGSTTICVVAVIAGLLRLMLGGGLF
jgi:hypothetical protein